MSYQSEILGIKDIAVEDIIRISTKYVPSAYRHAPWTLPELNHGVALLKTDDALCAYMAAYGEMHMIKCRSALRSLPFDDFINIEVVDWGCGQGMGTICLAEMLRERNKLQCLRKVTLIEPSEKALARAMFNVEVFTKGISRIVLVNKYLPSVSGHNDCTIEGISHEYKTVIHIFSNILDVEEVDIVKVAKLLPHTGTQQYIVCIGPKNKNSNRIDLFAKFFAPEKFVVDIDSAKFGITKNNHYFGCNAKVFEYNNEILDYNNIQSLSKTITNSPVFDDYDIELAKINGLINPNAEKFIRMLYTYVNNYGDLIYFNTSLDSDNVDVVILRPQTGVFLIKVFDYKLLQYSIQEQHIDVADDKLKEYNKLFASKCLRAENETISLPTTVLKHLKENLITLHLKNVSKERVTNKHYWSIVQSIGYFPHNTSEEVQNFFKNVNHPNEHLLGKDVTSQSLNKLLYKIGYFNSSKIFTNSCRQDFINVISPGWHSYREGQPITLTPTQSLLSRSQANIKQKIKGVAGAGKTEVMIHRAVQAQIRTGKQVLILTYNLSLRNYIRSRLAQVRADFAWNNFLITNYHQFIRGTANSFGLNLRLHSFEDEYFFDSVSESVPRYSAIFIDEIQDYKPCWLAIINKYFLSQDGELVVFGDPKQRIYENCTIDKNGDINIGVVPGVWNGSLERKMRFSNNQLSDLADQFLKKHINSDIELHNHVEQQLDFSNILYLKLDNTSMPAIVQRVRELLKYSEIDIAGDFVILAQTHTFIRNFECELKKLDPNIPVHSTSETQDEYDFLLHNGHYNGIENEKFREAIRDIQRAKKLHFSMNEEGLKLSTIHSYKGWDAENVLLFIESRIGNEFLTPQNIYTGITRARNKLLIVNLGNEVYHDCFEKYTINHV